MKKRSGEGGSLRLFRDATACCASAGRGYEQKLRLMRYGGLARNRLWGFSWMFLPVSFGDGLFAEIGIRNGP